MSLFAAALRKTGLSHVEASAFLSEQTNRHVSLDTIKNMANGRSHVHADVWSTLRELHAKMVDACEEALELITEKQPEDVELFEDGSRASEWPSLRVYENVLAMVALEGDFDIAN